MSSPVRAALLPAYPRKGWVTLSRFSLRASRWSARSSGGSFPRTSVEKTVLEAAKGVVFEHKRRDGRRQAVRISGSLPSHLQLRIEHVLDDLIAESVVDGVHVQIDHNVAGDQTLAQRELPPDRA